MKIFYLKFFSKCGEKYWQKLVTEKGILGKSIATLSSNLKM